jgi:hypothetical protein
MRRIMNKSEKNMKTKGGIDRVYYGKLAIHHGKSMSQQERQHMYNITLRHVCITIVAMEKQ